MHTQKLFQRTHSLASQVGIYLSGEVPGLPLKLSFTDNQYMDGYGSLFATAGRQNMDNGLDITRDDYKSGYFIFGFVTFPTLSLESLESRKEMKLFE